MKDSQAADLPESFFKFKPEQPRKYFSRLILRQKFGRLELTSKKWGFGALIVGVCLIEILLFCFGYYIHTAIGDNINIFAFNVPNEKTIIITALAGLGLFVLVLALVGGIMQFILNYSNLSIWKDPRFIWNQKENELSFFNGEIRYSSGTWQKICILYVSAYVPTPNMNKKFNHFGHLNLCVEDGSGDWQKYLVAAIGLVGNLETEARLKRQIVRLQELFGCDAVYVSYSKTGKQDIMTVPIEKRSFNPSL